eukprot:2340925-Rhodomonas_salina.1
MGRVPMCAAIKNGSNPLHTTQTRTDTQRDTRTHRETERQRDRETGRHTQTYTDIHRHTDTPTHRHTDTQTRLSTPLSSTSAVCHRAMAHCLRGVKKSGCGVECRRWMCEFMHVR